MAARSGERTLRLIQMIRNNLDTFEQDRDTMALDAVIFNLDILFMNLMQSGIEEDVVVVISNCLATLIRLRDIEDCINDSGVDHRIDNEATAKPGRPRYCILQEHLEGMIHLGLDCPTIASLLGVSLRTLRRRMTDFNLSIKDTYSSINELELELTIKSLKELYPNAGYRIMDGLLRVKGIKVTQNQLRDAMHSVDPDGILIRSSQCIQRRRYHVPGPQAMWHIDGCHKLVR